MSKRAKRVYEVARKNLLDALVDARLRSELDKKVSEKYEQIKAIAMETASMKRVQVEDIEGRRQQYRDKIKEKYPPATAKELDELFLDRWDEIVSQLSPIKQDMLNFYQVVPSNEYGQEGKAELIIKIRKTPAEKGHLKYYAKDPEMLEQLGKDISKIVGKTISVTSKDDDTASTEDKRKKDSLNLFLKKGLLVDVIESEDDRNG